MVRREQAARGFTLVELLIAIAVVAILLGILVPIASDSVRAAEDARCRTNLAQIARGLHLYARHNDGRPPDENSMVSWDAQLQPYITGQDAFRCPGDDSRFASTIGLSYGWRETDEVPHPRASLGRVRRLPRAGPYHLVMVFEMEANGHREDRVNIAQISTAAHSYDVIAFLDDIAVPVR